MISCFAFGDVLDDLGRATLEDVVLELVELGAHLAQHRERRVHARVHDPVEQVAGALREGRRATDLAIGVPLEHRGERRQVLVGQGDQEVRPHEDVHLRREQAVLRLVEHREVENDEQVVIVGVQLGALVARRDVLDGERVEAELPLQPLAIRLTRVLEVQPADTGRYSIRHRARANQARQRSRGRVRRPGRGATAVATAGSALGGTPVRMRGSYLKAALVMPAAGRRRPPRRTATIAAPREEDRPRPARTAARCRPPRPRPSRSPGR